MNGPTTIFDNSMLHFCHLHIDNLMMRSLFKNSQYALYNHSQPLLSSRKLSQLGMWAKQAPPPYPTLTYMSLLCSFTRDLPCSFTCDFLGLEDHCGSGNADCGEGCGSAEVLSYFEEAGYQIHLSNIKV